MINKGENFNSKLFVVKQNRLNKTLQLVKAIEQRKIWKVIPGHL